MEEGLAETDKSDAPKMPSCVSFISYWRRCTYCRKEKDDIKNCLKYKSTRSEEYKEKVLQAVKAWEDEENFVARPSSTVWEFRENPAEDWAKKGV